MINIFKLTLSSLALILSISSTAKGNEPLIDNMKTRQIIGKEFLTILSVKNSQLALNNQEKERLMENIPKGTFYLTRKKISQLPEEIQTLKWVSHLSLTYNNLCHLPQTMKDLTNLKTLDLTSNQIYSLSPWVSHLTSLTSLIIINNPIQDLPTTMQNLTKLTKIACSNTPLSKIFPQMTIWNQDLLQLYCWCKSIYDKYYQHFCLLKKLSGSSTQRCEDQELPLEIQQIIFSHWIFFHQTTTNPDNKNIIRPINLETQSPSWIWKICAANKY